MIRRASETLRVPACPEHPYTPVIRNLPPRAGARSLRVVAFNAAGGARTNEIVRRLSAPPLAGSSIILLCEADWRTRRSGRREVASELAQRLSMSMAYLPEFGRPMGGAVGAAFMGNAILSAAPLEEVRVIAMPDPSPESARKLRPGYAGGFAGMAARAKFGSRSLWIGVVHLHSRCGPAGRALQLAEFLAGFPDEGAAVFGGDLNSTTTELNGPLSFARTFGAMLLKPRRFKDPVRYEPMFERINAAGFDIEEANLQGYPTFTFSRVIPPLFRPRLDWIALRGVRAAANSAAVIPARWDFISRRFSDHDFITVAVDSG
jgi:endonuclease/exonuclease/phosphatase family metal-dependent hydrolase